MTILTCPNKQKQYDEMVSEISEISNEINQEAKQDNTLLETASDDE